MANFSVRRPFGDLSRRFLLLPALLSAGVILISGCHPAVTDPKDPKFVVAQKGTWTISRAELDTEVNSFLQQHQATAEQVGPAKMPMVETMMLKNMVLKKLMLDKAAGLQLTDVDKEEAAQLDEVKQSIPPGSDFNTALKTAGMTLDDLKQKIHDQVLIHKVLEAEAFQNVAPTDQQIDAIYLAHKDAFNIPQKVRASRVLILVDDKATDAEKAAKKAAITKAHERVVKGEDFSKVATEVSEDQYSKAKGGDLGFFAKGDNPDKGFDDVAFNTKLNTISPVFQTSFGYQFIKVTAIQPPGVVPLADARSYISGKLKDQNMQTASQAYAKKLLADSNVTYNINLVDPPAQAAAGAGADDASGAAPDNGQPQDPNAAPGQPDASQMPPQPDASQMPAPAPAPDQSSAPPAPEPAPASK